MTRLGLVGVAQLALSMGLATASHGGQVTMKNGDRITGSIEQIWDNEVIIEPEYSSDVKVNISLDDVAYIESERKFEITLAGETVMVARLAGRADDGLQLIEINGQTIAIDLNRLLEVEEMDAYRDWESHIDFNLALNKGNTDSLNTKFFADTNLKLGDHRHIASLTLNREEQDRITTKEQDILRYNYNWIFSDPWFFGVAASAERDPIRNLDHRFILGATSGRDIWNRPRLFLNFQIGAGYLTEKDTIGETQESIVAIWALRYRQDFFATDLEVYHDDSINVYLTGRSNTVIKTSTGMRYEFTDLLYMNVSLDYDYESDPAGTAENDDLSLVIGLGIEF